MYSVIIILFFIKFVIVILNKKLLHELYIFNNFHYIYLTVEINIDLSVRVFIRIHRIRARDMTSTWISNTTIVNGV